MKKIISTNGAPAPIGPYSQAVKINGFLYVSGQIAIDPLTGKLVNESIETETKQVMKNIGEILKSAGMDYSNIIKTSVFLTDMNNFKTVNEVYGSCFKNDFPARETVAVSRLPKDASVEISVIASGQ